MTWIPYTGLPDIEGWYLVKYRCIHESINTGKIEYRAIHRYKWCGVFIEDGGIGADEIWQPIEYIVLEVST